VHEIDVEFADVCRSWHPAWLSFHDPASSICRYNIDKRLSIADKLFDIFSIQRIGKDAKVASVIHEEKNIYNIFENLGKIWLNELAEIKFFRTIGFLDLKI